eukprot:6481478-Pyramimonas_sp.AAC.2
MSAAALALIAQVDISYHMMFHRPKNKAQMAKSCLKTSRFCLIKSNARTNMASHPSSHPSSHYFASCMQTVSPGNPADKLPFYTVKYHFHDVPMAAHF